MLGKKLGKSEQPWPLAPYYPYHPPSLLGCCFLLAETETGSYWSTLGVLREVSAHSPGIAPGSRTAFSRGEPQRILKKKEFEF